MKRRNLIRVWRLILAQVPHQPCLYKEFQSDLKKSVNKKLGLLGTESDSSAADSAQPAHRGYNHLCGRFWGSTSGSVHTKMISNTSAENLTNSVTQEPARQNSQRNLLTWHHRFHYQWCIRFHALCILFLKQSGEEKLCKHHTRKKPSIYGQPKIAANILMNHSAAANSVSVTCFGGRIWLLNMV